MADKDRFEKVYYQGIANMMEIWVDKQTGVNYLVHMAANAGGIPEVAGYRGDRLRR